jgi:uncharacterized protein YbjT (DUF2867 family)
MSVERKLILVTGATGRQGGAVARCLLDSGFNVRFLTRELSKPAAQSLIGAGATGVLGDLDNESSLRPAIEGVYGVFSVQDSHEHGPLVEIEQGKRLADLAREYGAQHFVYTSVGAADRNTGIPFFDSKWEIESHIRSLGLRYTILRPVFFMENLLGPQMWSQIESGKLMLGLHPNVPLQFIAVRDIGAFACLAFSKPGEWVGKEIEIAGDELTPTQCVEHFSRALGRTITYSEIPIEQLRSMDPGYATMFDWFNRHGYRADIEALRQLHPDLLDFDQWLKTAIKRAEPLPLRKAA